MEIVKGWISAESDDDSLKRPDMRVQYDYRYALREAVWIKRTGTNHIRPLSEVESVDALWERDVSTALTTLKWLENYYSKLSPEDRAAIEKTEAATE